MRQAELDRVAQLFREVFTSDAGAEVLEDLARRFPADARRFRKQRDGGPVDPYLAAVRDGEGAVVAFIKDQVRKADANERKRHEAERE